MREVKVNLSIADYAAIFAMLFFIGIGVRRIADALDRAYPAQERAK